MAGKIVIWDEDGIKDYKRVRDKVDGFNGTGVSNTPVSMSICIPPVARRPFPTPPIEAMRFIITTPPSPGTLGTSGLPDVALCKPYDRVNGAVGDFTIAVKVYKSCWQDAVFVGVRVMPSTDLLNPYDQTPVLWEEKVDDPVRYGKVITDTSSGNTISLTPVRAENDTTATGESTVICTVSWPEAGSPAPFSVHTNDVLAWIPFGNNVTNKGALLPLGSSYAPETVTLVTDVRVDGATQKLQKKTRTFQAIPTAAESGWTDVHTGVVCP